MKNYLCLLPLVFLFLFSSGQNPLIMDQFTADPSARVFEGKVYVYPSHDIPCGPGQGFIGFCMSDYHVFSSVNLTDWEDHGVIVSQDKVEWVDSTRYGMWAPDCIFKNGKYYFYFPSIQKNSSARRGYRVGVAVADSPAGPFLPEPKPMEGVYGIDPNVFIDHDGQAYMYWGSGENLLMAKLKDNMLELASEPQKVLNLPPKFKEGSYLFERNGIYYFTFPYVPETTEQLVYAMGDNPMGPFTFTGIIMDESPVKCWTNHHSIIEYNNQWYLFYHHNDLSPKIDKNRSIKADSLFFNADGTIQKVLPSLRGVGISNAESKIHPDRYSSISGPGISIAFTDTLNLHAGWKVRMEKEGSWVRYNRVDFSNPSLKKMVIRSFSPEGGSYEIRLDGPGGPLLAKGKINKPGEWNLQEAKLKKYKAGIYDLVIVSMENTPVEIDWIRFK